MVFVSSWSLLCFMETAQLSSNDLNMELQSCNNSSYIDNYCFQAWGFYSILSTAIHWVFARTHVAFPIFPYLFFFIQIFSFLFPLFPPSIHLSPPFPSPSFLSFPPSLFSCFTTISIQSAIGCSWQKAGGCAHKYVACHKWQSTVTNNIYKNDWLNCHIYDLGLANFRWLNLLGSG